jgi:hypothetical protein
MLAIRLDPDHTRGEAVGQGLWGCDDSSNGIGCRAMSENPQHYPQQQQYGYQPQPAQGYPGQQPWADPQQPQPQQYGHAPQQQQQQYGYAPQQQQQQYGYAPQQQQQQPQGYQAQPLPAGQNAGAPNASNALQCRFCGSYPAKKATFRGHRGMIVVMQFLGQKGPFCRDCGISTFRDMTSKTLVQGWWGYASFIITPFILLWNLLQRLKFNDLPAPQPARDGTSVAPMPLGKPLYLRPTMAGLLVPVLAIGAIGYAIASGAGSSQNLVGQCIKVAANNDVDFVGCDKPNDGQVIAVVQNESECSAEATGVVERFSRSRTGSDRKLDVLCVK